MGLDEDKILVERDGNFVICGVEGNALILSSVREKYVKEGKLGDSMDFGPIFRHERKGDLCYHLFGNIYEPMPCTLNVIQYSRLVPNTLISCVGIGDIAVELLCDFAAVIKLLPCKPSEEFSKGLFDEQSTARSISDGIRCLDPESQKSVLRDVFRNAKELFEEKDKIAKAHLN